MISGRGNCTANNAKSAPGYYAWDYGTRRSREIFRDDWEPFEQSGVEGIINHKLKLKVTIVSTDSGTCDKTRSPRNRTPKGPATERMTDLNGQYELLPREVKSSPDGYMWWELCVYDNGHEVRAELSTPIDFEGAHFIKFGERIFLVNPREWKDIRIIKPDASDPVEFDIDIRRK